MRKLILFLTTFLTINFSYSQELRKSEDIHRSLSPYEILSCTKVLENDSLKSIYISLLGQNSKYTHITDIVTVFFGAPNEFYTFIKKVEEFCNQDPGTSMELNGHHIMVDKLLGIKHIVIYTSDLTGYMTFNLKRIVKFKTKFEEWAKEKNIVLN